MNEPTSNTIDLTDPDAVHVEVTRIVKEIWADHIQGLPLVLAVNLTAHLNGAVLHQFTDPDKLLYAIDRNALVMEGVIETLANKIGREKMDAALENRTEDGYENNTEVLH